MCSFCSLLEWPHFLCGIAWSWHDIFLGAKIKKTSLYSAFLLAFHVVVCSMKQISDSTKRDFIYPSHFTFSKAATVNSFYYVSISQSSEQVGLTRLPCISQLSLGLVSSNNIWGFMTRSRCVWLSQEGFSFSYFTLPPTSLSARGTLNFTDLKTLFHKSELTAKKE